MMEREELNFDLFGLCMFALMKSARANCVKGAALMLVISFSWFLK